ncbi:hypothetical protein FI667_g9791, partial [Globisporangium splendens]
MKTSLSLDQLPIREVGSVVFSQSMAISRYAALPYRCDGGASCQNDQEAPFELVAGAADIALFTTDEAAKDDKMIMFLNEIPLETMT